MNDLVNGKYTYISDYTKACKDATSEQLQVALSDLKIEKHRIDIRIASVRKESNRRNKKANEPAPSENGQADD